MVVVCSPRYPTSGTLIPRVERIQNATNGNSFDIKLQNPSSLLVADSLVDCMVIEEGIWEFPDGRLIEGQNF